MMTMDKDAKRMSEDFAIDIVENADRLAWDMTGPDGVSPPLQFDHIEPSPVLELFERGGIIFPEVFRAKTNDPSAFMKHLIYVGDFNPGAVMVGLLLFDRLDYPLNSMLCPEPGAPEGLQGWPGFKRSAVMCGGNMSIGMFSQIAHAAFSALDKREEGRWAMVRGLGGVSLPADMLEPRAGFQLKLIDALPVPAGEAPYEDVLLFKERRRDELLALRAYLDELVLEVAGRGFGGLAETVAFERFHKALAAHAKAMSEANVPKSVLNVDITANLGGTLTWALEAATSALGLPGVGAAIGGAISPSLSFKSADGLKGEGRKAAPFDYLVKAGRELYLQ